MCDKWISVEDRLPEEGEDVLLFDGMENMLVGYKKRRSEKGVNWLVSGVGEWRTIITHWQPLPEPPEPLDE